MARETLESLIRRELGADTNTVVNREVTTVGVAAVVVLRQNPNRIGFLLVNLSANTIFVGPFRDVAAAKGILLGPGGGSLSTNWKEDGQLIGWEWSGIATAAASAILTVELLTLPFERG